MEKYKLDRSVSASCAKLTYFQSLFTIHCLTERASSPSVFPKYAFLAKSHSHF